MKTDREFLDGVYAKAEKLRTGDDPAKILPFIGNASRRRSVWGTVVAACMALLLTGGFLYENAQPKMEIPEGYTNLLENVPMILNEIGTRTIAVGPFEGADVVAAGKVSGIAKSVYEEGNQSIITMVAVNLTEIYKGQPSTASINVAVAGGVNEEDKTYLDYEAVFRRGENVLLFLSEREDGSYTLCGGAEGKLSRLKGKGREATYAYPDGEQVCLNDLIPEADEESDGN